MAATNTELITAAYNIINLFLICEGLCGMICVKCPEYKLMALIYRILKELVALNERLRELVKGEEHE